MGFIPGLRDGSIFANQSMLYTTLMKERIRTIWFCQYDGGKAFGKIQHPFLIKTFKKIWIEGIYLNITKAIYERPTADIFLKGEKQRDCPLRWRTRQGCPVSPLLFSIVLNLLLPWKKWVSYFLILIFMWLYIYLLCG